MKEKRIFVRLTEKQLDKLKSIAKERGQTMSAMIRILIEDFKS